MRALRNTSTVQGLTCSRSRPKQPVAVRVWDEASAWAQISASASASELPSA